MTAVSLRAGAGGRRRRRLRLGTVKPPRDQTAAAGMTLILECPDCHSPIEFLTVAGTAEAA